MNPRNQFIEIAPDCTLRAAVIPQEKNGRKSIAAMEFELLISKPYHYTLEELKFAVHVLQKQIPAAEMPARRNELWDELFARPCACMRASPLTKQYGWGVHYDEQGRIAIYAVESEEYRRFAGDSAIKKYSAMRSKRA